MNVRKELLNGFSVNEVKDLMSVYFLAFIVWSSACADLAFPSAEGGMFLFYTVESSEETWVSYGFAELTHLYRRIQELS